MVSEVEARVLDLGLVSWDDGSELGTCPGSRDGVSDLGVSWESLGVEDGVW